MKFKVCGRCNRKVILDQENYHYKWSDKHYYHDGCYQQAIESERNQRLLSGLTRGVFYGAIIFLFCCSISKIIRRKEKWVQV